MDLNCVSYDRSKAPAIRWELPSTGCCRIRRCTARRFITQASADKRPKTMPPRTNRWKALRRVASPGKRSSAPQYVAVRIAQAVMPERKLRTGDFMNRQVGTSVNSPNAMARARLRWDANRSRYETRFAASSHARPTPEKPIPRRTPRRNAGFRTHPLRTWEAGIGSSLRILAVAQ